MPTGSDHAATAVSARHRVRAVGNAINLSTLLGLLVAAAGRARLRRGPEALLVAEGYRLPVPSAGAFTVGNVVIVPRGRLSDLERRNPTVLAHEAEHAWQYAACLGLPFLPLYALASGWSWLRTGDPWSRNVFERDAGLNVGGYVENAATNAGLKRLAGLVRRTARP